MKNKFKELLNFISTFFAIEEVKKTKPKRKRKKKKLTEEELFIHKQRNNKFIVERVLITGIEFSAIIRNPMHEEFLKLKTPEMIIEAYAKDPEQKRANYKTETFEVLMAILKCEADLRV